MIQIPKKNPGDDPESLNESKQMSSKFGFKVVNRVTLSDAGRLFQKTSAR